MLINLSDVLTSEGKAETADVILEMTAFRSKLGNFPIIEKEPVHFLFTNNGKGRAKITGSVRLVFQTKCDRCLDDVPLSLALNFERDIFAPDVEAECPEEEDILRGYQFDAEDFINSEILINWPLKILCREDCKGVCPVCGRNRNKGSCGCDTFVPDPRLAMIQNIFNANKEV